MVEWWVGHDEKKNRIGANFGRFAPSTNRICASSLAFPSERTGGVAIARLCRAMPETGGREPDALIRLALIHYQFEAIRPFGDANGRTGRILNILYLIDQDLLDMPILYLSRYIIQHKSEYYSRLRRVTEREEWIIFMLNAVRETADWTYDRIQAMKSLLDETIAVCKEKLPKIYSYDLVEEIFLQPYCKPAYLVDAGIGNRQTAMKYLKSLEDVGILASVRIGKERIYVNTRLFVLLKFDEE